MEDVRLPAQYATGDVREGIARALVAAGKGLDRLVPADLALVEDYHSGGRLLTVQLADLAGVTAESRVLDDGAGIGGTARYLAERFGCSVTAVDLSAEYCETARWLNGLVGLDGIDVRQADVTALPFGDDEFDVVFSQHVQMNVSRKDLLYGEARRVLRDGGRLAVWDLAAGDARPLDYPLPWADGPGDSHLVTSDQLRGQIEGAGFAVELWADLTDQVAGVMRAVQALPPNPLGLHAFVPSFRERGKHLIEALSDGRLRAIQVISR